MRNEKWMQLEDWIVQKISCLDPHIRTSKGSGNKGEKGDVYFSSNIGLHIEAKWRNLKSVYNQEWFDKSAKEVPYYVDKIPILVTENNKSQKTVHINADDFFDMYIEYYELKNGG